jgi:hypothetical protein
MRYVRTMRLCKFVFVRTIMIIDRWLSCKLTFVRKMGQYADEKCDKQLIFMSSTESSKITKGKHIDKHAGRLAYDVLYIGIWVPSYWGNLQTLWTNTKMEAKSFSDILACIH